MACEKVLEQKPAKSSFITCIYPLYQRFEGKTTGNKTITVNGITGHL